ncbi:MAG: hypothetical protein WC533_04470 [Candidatus Pacearchaeota archaeon]
MEYKQTKSKKPLKKVNKKTPERTSIENIEETIVELGKKGNTPSKIGIILKEKYGIQKAKLLGKKITKILKEHKVVYETDLDLVNKKLSKIEKHYEKNKQDKRANREIVRFIGLKKKMEKYQKKKKR